MIAKNKITIDNKGFTLLEVLVAMVILTIISVPLIRAFATSAFTNQKAKTEMLCTTASENIIETFRNLPVDEPDVYDIIDKYNAQKVDDMSVLIESAEENRYMVTGSGVYSFAINNKDDMSADLPEGYFAVVDLNGQKYNYTNNLNPISLGSVSADNSAIYTMETEDKYNEISGEYEYSYSRIDEEEYALWEHDSNEYIDSLTGVNESKKSELKNKYNKDFFRENLSREITYTIGYVKTVPVEVANTKSGATESGTKTKDVDVVVVDLVIKYVLEKGTYNISDLPLKPASNEVYEYYNGVYTHINTGTEDKDDENHMYTLFDNTKNNKRELDSVYLFFYPRYAAGAIDGKRDKINIVNLNNVECNVYLVALENSHPNEWPSKTTYRSAKKLKVNIDGPNSDESNITLRTNVTKLGAPYSLDDPDGNGEIDFNLIYTKNYIDGSGDPVGAGTITDQQQLLKMLHISGVDGKLLSLDSDSVDKRIYNMTVRIYNRNQVDAMGGYELVMKMNGSKLD